MFWYRHNIVDKYVENPMIKLLITKWISTAHCRDSAMSGYPQRFEKDKRRFSTVFHQQKICYIFFSTFPQKSGKLHNGLSLKRKI